MTAVASTKTSSGTLAGPPLSPDVRGGAGGAATPPAPPPTHPAAALCVALVIGAASAWLAWVAARLEPTAVRDLDPVLFAARALVHGHDPFPLVGPGRAFEFPWGLYYPPPALFLLAPLAALPIAVARVAFVGLSSALLAFVLVWRRGAVESLPVFANACFLNAVRNAQWSPLLMALALLPPAAGALYIVKPNLGLTMLAMSDSRRRVAWAALGGLALLAIGLLVLPRWPLEWWDAVHDAPQLVVPLRRPGGALLLLALLRWRRPEARLLAAMAVVPATGIWYEALPCFLVPRTVRSGVALALLSLVGFHVAGTLVDTRAAAFDRQSWVIGNVVLWSVQLPALAMVLRRPNEGRVPAWADRAAAAVMGLIPRKGAAVRAAYDE